MSSSEQEFQLLTSQSSRNIDELQDANLVEILLDNPVSLAITPFGLDASKNFLISRMLSTTSQGSLTRQHSYNSETQELRHKRLKTMDSPPWQRQLTHLCCEKLLCSLDEFDAAIETDIDVKMFHRDWGDRKGFVEQLKNSTRVAYKELPKKTYDERVMEVEDGHGEYFEKACGQWVQYIKNVIKVPNMHKIFEIMNMQMKKVKTVYLYGAQSGGKSAMIRLLKSVYRDCEVGRAGAQAINSNFWLEDMIGKRIAILEEIVVTGINVNSVKQLMEGNDDHYSNVKYEKSRKLEPMPVIIASNQEITLNCGAHYGPLMARCLKLTLPGDTTYELYYDNKIMRQILKRIYVAAYCAVRDKSPPAKHIPDTYKLPVNEDGVIIL